MATQKGSNNEITSSVIHLAILIFLKHNEGESTFSDIVDYLNRHKSQVSATIKSLTHFGLIEKKADTRPLIIRITKKGNEIRKNTIYLFEKCKQKKKNHLSKITASELVHRSNRRINSNKSMENLEDIIQKAKKLITEVLIESNVNLYPEELQDLVNTISDRLMDLLYTLLIPKAT
ncbi:MAG: hypothetical protein BAJALOKI2v1_530027 [Promethearchaeota archaeon]|nr:MAG: hypothetical protein BAJALOKI2v1_530027 [Candidatus Lokiarchaeota archaeon]